MVALRAMRVAILLIALAGGGGCGELMYLVATAPALLEVSYPATLERTLQAYLEVLKELGFKNAQSATGRVGIPGEPFRRYQSRRAFLRYQSRRDSGMLDRVKSFRIVADRAADEFSVSISGESFDPAKTTVYILSGPTYGTEGLRNSIHRKVLERLSKQPE